MLFLLQLQSRTSQWNVILNTACSLALMQPEVAATCNVEGGEPLHFETGAGASHSQANTYIVIVANKQAAMFKLVALFALALLGMVSRRYAAAARSGRI
jgi:hypothetical protein